MTLVYVIPLLLFFSFLWALLSLKHELDTPHHVHTKRKLAREKILFKAK